MTTANKSVALILVLIAAIGASTLLIGRLPQTRTELQHALRLPEARELPEFQLLDQDGKTLNNDWFKGRWTMVFFGFTHCPDICPATLSILAAARKRLADADIDSNDAATLPDILLISVDPARDTPQPLRQYVKHFGKGVSGATGELPELLKLTTILGIYFERESSEAGASTDDYNVAHSAHVIVIDDLGRFSAIFSPPHSVDAFVADMPVLMTLQ